MRSGSACSLDVSGGIIGASTCGGSMVLSVRGVVESIEKMLVCSSGRQVCDRERVMCRSRNCIGSPRYPSGMGKA